MGVKVISNFDRAKRILEKDFENKLRAAAAQVRVEVVLLLNRTNPATPRVSASTGNPYLVGTSPSKPGEPPKRVAGTLFRSIIFGVARRGGRLIGFVGSTDEKAPWLEFGTARMAARPFMRPGLRNARRKIERIFARPAHGK